MDNQSPPSLPPLSLTGSIDKTKGTIHSFSPNVSRLSSQNFPIVLPPIKEGEHYSNSNGYEPGQEIYPLASRRFSLPSISSFDQPAPRNMCSPVGFRKLSLPSSSFQGLAQDLNQAFVQNEAGMHVCQFPGCYWSFKRGEHLKRHMSVHTRERPYVCSYPGCNRSFSRSDNLNVHHRTHLDANNTNIEESKHLDSYKRRVSSPELNDIYYKKAINGNYLPFKKNVDNATYQIDPRTSYSTGPHLASILPPNDAHKSITLPSLSSLAGTRDEEKFIKPSVVTDVNHSYYRPDTTPNFSSSYSKSYKNQNPLEQLASVATISSMASLNSYVRPKPTVTETDSKLIWTDLDDEGRPIKYYVCQFKGCNMKFKRSEHLTRHRLVHTMERPFSCTHPGCNKAFSRADNLRQHTRIHSRPHPSQNGGHNGFNPIRIGNATPYIKSQNELSSQGFSRKP